MNLIRKGLVLLVFAVGIGVISALALLEASQEVLIIVATLYIITLTAILSQIKSED